MTSTRPSWTTPCRTTLSPARRRRRRSRQRRREAVLAVLRAAGVAARRRPRLRRRCADRRAARATARSPRWSATDVSARALGIAARRLKLDLMPEAQRARLRLFQSSLTYRDARLAGLDAAVLHGGHRARRPRPAAGAGAGRVRVRGTGMVVVTTPNGEYNARYGTCAGGACGTPTTGSSGTAPSSPRGRPVWPTATATACGSPGRAGRPGGRGRRPRWPCSPRDRAGAAVVSASLGIPELRLVVLVGVTGSGKSTFARTHFKPTEVISRDFCRGLVSDDENDQSATADAFDVLHYIAGKRLAAGRLTVVDATNVQPEARRPLVALAREHDVLPVAIVLDSAGADLRGAQRRRGRTGRSAPHVVRRQQRPATAALRSLQRRASAPSTCCAGRGGVAAVDVDRQTALQRPSDDHRAVRRDRRRARLPRGAGGAARRAGLRASPETSRGGAVGAASPEGRRAVFVGDLVDRGPDTPGVLRLVMGMVAGRGRARRAGNHENKLLRALRGRNVQITHGLAETLAQLAASRRRVPARSGRSCDGLISHYVLDDGRLVVAHAGLPSGYQGRASGPGARRSACTGDTTGETDEYGLPVRYPWATEYRGPAMVLYGHTPVPAPEWVNNTLCLDTGCVFGGSLTALRYPERSSSPSRPPACTTSRPSRSRQRTPRPGSARPRSSAGRAGGGGRREPAVARPRGRDRYAGDRDRLPGRGSRSARRTRPPRSR